MKGDILSWPGVFSLLMGVLSFGLPHTPPRKEGAKPWAFLEALKMFKDKNFLIFAVISFRRRHRAPVLLRPDRALPDVGRDRRQPEVRLRRS